MILLPLFVLFIAQQDDGFGALREKMVKGQIEARGVSDEKVLAAMRKVPRHLFVNKEIRHLAYTDQALPINYNQTISQPYIVALMTEAIAPQPHHRVLEIGTGSGYQAAVLAEIVKEVYTLEIIPGLAKEGEATLKAQGYKNVHVKASDGYFGWKEHAPFDAIVVTAATTEIPQPLLDQLKEGGKMIIPIGASGTGQSLTLVTKSEGKIKKKHLLPVIFVPFTRDDE